MATLHANHIMCFNLLKQKIVATMQVSYPGINADIKQWKGQEITDFQEELLSKVNARISEKWFYNHIKKDNENLPRIDVLNFLSKYAGYANWDDFVFKNAKTISGKKSKNVSQANHIFVLVPVVLVVIIGLLYLMFMVFTHRTVELSFYDAYTQKPITGQIITVATLQEGESGNYYHSDSAGLVLLKTSKSVIGFRVSTPYYKTDTITRVLRSFEKNHSVELFPNDYALVIRSFSRQNVTDWKNRREFLGSVIDDNAIIYQVLNSDKKHGMALYNKSEFIDKLSVPTGSLKNIEVLETRFQDEKIVLLRFVVKTAGDE